MLGPLVGRLSRPMTGVPRGAAAVAWGRTFSQNCPPFPPPSFPQSFGTKLCPQGQEKNQTRQTLLPPRPSSRRYVHTTY